MESVLGRYRNLTILVGVLFLQVLGLAVQVKRSADPQNTRLIRIWAVDTITPFERVLVWAQNGSRSLWRNYFFLRGVRAENRELKQQIEQMRLEQVRLGEDAEQAHRLQELLAFKEQVIAKTVPAQVIGSSGSDLSRSIYIDKGSNDGIATDMAVITAGGIVGKVLRVYPSTSLVLMINDQTSGVGAMLEQTRLQGVLRGTPDGEVILERVMSDEQVAPGDVLLSSGGDQIFPKGLPVGTVTKVSPGHEMFLKIEVKPAADLSRLEEVLVVTEKQEQDAVVDTGARVRAADILAQRLPSVPDKPASDAKAAGSAASGTTGESSEAAAKLPTPAAGSAKPDGVQHESTPVIAKGKSGSTADRSAGAAPSSSGKHNGSSVLPTSSQIPNNVPNNAAKKTPPQAASGDPVPSGGSKPVGSSTAVSASKPAAPRPKSTASKPDPQLPATADDPH